MKQKCAPFWQLRHGLFTLVIGLNEYFIADVFQYPIKLQLYDVLFLFAFVFDFYDYHSRQRITWSSTNTGGRCGALPLIIE